MKRRWKQGKRAEKRTGEKRGGQRSRSERGIVQADGRRGKKRRRVGRLEFSSGSRNV
ncbi:hypothetical protein TIFTF001_007913 [Ficus carica]|uniref:Uncharacterized protein n=1 Tax=Ficus carica TaxID=3494 RepID=A0AA87ZSG5_FICCA|nr:hypothetical protein TIFTF001_007913 [Ficus carica]